MRRPVAIALIGALTCAVCVGWSAGAALPPAARFEIVELLRRVGASGCEFRRNGANYDATRAEQHLHRKFDAVAGGNGIASTEEFIDKVATRSSLTGLPYEVKCAGAPAVPSGQWLLEQLAQMRRPGASDARP